MKQIFMALMVVFYSLNTAWAGVSMYVNNSSVDQQQSHHSFNQTSLVDINMQADMPIHGDHCPSMAVEKPVETIADNSCLHSGDDCLCDVACPASVSSVVFQSFSFAAVTTEQSYGLLFAEQFSQVIPQGLDRPPRLN